KRAWKSVLRTLRVVRPAPAKTTPPVKSLAPVRLMVLPAVTVKVAGPAPFRWVTAFVEVRLPVAAVAVKVQRPRASVAGGQAALLTSWRGGVAWVGFRLIVPEKALAALVSVRGKSRRTVIGVFPEMAGAALCVMSPPAVTPRLPLIV